MFKAWLAALCALSPLISMGYGVDTHAVMSIVAVDESILSQEALFKEWGIDGSATTYGFPRPSDGRVLLVKNLVALEGAMNEDKVPRPLNHFFDPINQMALNVCGATLGQSSPQWAVFGIDQSDPRFSFAQARTSMDLAFSGSTQGDRNRNFGIMFESLGHVIHHIQDMAQPQHVRNDQHFVGTNKSRYETYTDRIATSLSFGGYQNVRMAAPVDYWRNSQGTGLAEFTNANFVSQGSNFQLLDGLIVRNDRYALPSPSDWSITNIEEVFTAARVCPDPKDQRCSLRGRIVFISNVVTDKLTGAPGLVNLRAASYSIWNQDLERTNLLDRVVTPCGDGVSLRGRVFTVNELTFLSALEFLVPRAVGYSAGMIDYFFRGKIDLVPHLLDDGSSDGTFDFINLGDEPLSGNVRLYYDDADGLRFPVVGGEWPVTNLAPQAKITAITIPEPTFPVPHKAGVYMMVFTGTMGAETPIFSGPGAVVAKLVKVPAPEIYWSFNAVGDTSPPKPPGLVGSLEVSFSLPLGMDKFLKQNFSNGHVKVNGRDYLASTAMTPASCGESGFPGADEMAYEAPTETVQWITRYFSDNRVLYEDLGVINPFYGWADGFLDMRVRSPNYIPFCGNQVFAMFPNPYQNNTIEYFVGSRLLFKFCSRLEPDPNGQYGTPKLVLSRIQGARVHDQAIGVRVESPPVIACAGF